MKGIDLLCSSPASTAICIAAKTEYSSMARHGNGHGGRKIDRHNPHLRDSRRANPPTTTTTTTNTKTNASSSTSTHQFQPHSSTKANNKHNKSHKARKSNHNNGSSTKSPKQQQGLLIGGGSPSGSSRYLLSDSVFFDVVTEFEPVTGFVTTEQSSSGCATAFGSTIDRLSKYGDGIGGVDDFPAMGNHCSSSASSSSTIASTSSSSSPDQVVVLRVSLHCKGCEGKVRKHISRMKGVKSFNIDFQAKKVTVIGDVTPVGVLASISRVKRAQFWHSPSPLSVTSKF